MSYEFADAVMYVLAHMAGIRIDDQVRMSRLAEWINEGHITPENYRKFMIRWNKRTTDEMGWKIYDPDPSLSDRVQYVMEKDITLRIEWY